MEGWRRQGKHSRKGESREMEDRGEEKRGGDMRGEKRRRDCQEPWDCTALTTGI